VSHLVTQQAEPTPAARDRLKITFESRADQYHAARPEYPDELYDALVAAAGLRRGARVLEVGCGTGKATIALAERGFDITALEIGPRLAEAARANLAGYDRVRVLQLPFEAWRPDQGEPFDLVCAATAWHWVDPEVGYRVASDSLAADGHLAIWTAQHVLPDDGDPFFLEIQDVYDEIGNSLPSDDYFPRPGSLPTNRAAIEGSGLFVVTLEQEFIWARDYPATQYIALLDTFSSHIEMAAWQRDRLYGEITRRLAARPNGTVRRHWGTVLQLARRLD
jgi:SAM-dependent methyltransferase